MRIPKIIINIMCDNNILLPFHVECAPNISNDQFLQWLFSGTSRQTLACSGPVTNEQLRFLTTTYTTGELLHINKIFKFENAKITDIVKRIKTPITVQHIHQIFHRKFDEYVEFYFLLVNGLKHGSHTD